MAWEYRFFAKAKRDLEKLDNSQRLQVFRALDKVVQNPLPKAEGGYGTPLGNKAGANLTGFMKIKLKASGIRIVYRLVKQDGKMCVIVVGLRADEEVYRDAAARLDAFEDWLESDSVGH